MTDWKRTPFESLLIESKDGEWGLDKASVGFREALIVRGTDFSNLNNAIAEFPQRWVKDGIVERKQLRACDLILETAGGTSTQSTGRTALVTKSFMDHHAHLPVLCASFSRYLRLHTEKYSPYFIYYLLQGLYRSGYMAVFNTQHTGISRFQYTAFKKHTELRIPKISVQRKIAAILSTYDELIQNNKRRIALLEKLAEEIYREWFVRFRFPSYQRTKSIKAVPSGWSVKKLGEVLVLNYGKALKEVDRMPGEFSVYGSSGVVGTHTSALVERAGLIVGRKGNVGSVYWSDRPFFPIDTVYYVESELPNSFLYFLLRSMNFINNDAAVPGLNRSQAYANEFFLPSSDLISQYAEVVDSQFKMKHLLTRQNDSLMMTRDLLLPRLISGKLSVESLDIQFPPGMMEELDQTSDPTHHA